MRTIFLFFALLYSVNSMGKAMSLKVVQPSGKKAYSGINNFSFYTNVQPFGLKTFEAIGGLRKFELKAKWNRESNEFEDVEMFFTKQDMEMWNLISTIALRSLLPFKGDKFHVRIPGSFQLGVPQELPLELMVGDKVIKTTVRGYADILGDEEELYVRFSSQIGLDELGVNIPGDWAFKIQNRVSMSLQIFEKLENIK